jgi:hypothetical protein
MSFAIENVVSDPRVISICLLISTTSISWSVGIEADRWLRPPACRMMATATSFRECRRVVQPSPHIATSLPSA